MSPRGAMESSLGRHVVEPAGTAVGYVRTQSW